MLSDMKIFIWQGDWKGGAEEVTLGIASYLRDTTKVIPTLGIFTGMRRDNLKFPQIEIKRIFPKRLVAYNNIWASIALRRRLGDFDLIITHTAGFWRQKRVKVLYREPGDLDALFKNIRFRSKLTYFIPYLVALSLVKKAELLVSASRRADNFFERHGRKDFIMSTNFIDTERLPEPRKRVYDGGRFNLVFVGRDDPIKNLDSLVGVVEGLRNSLPIHLDVFGVQRKDTHSTTYHGWKEEGGLLDSIDKHSHLFILPSRFEASPLMLIKALAMGIPCVVSENAVPEEMKKYVIAYGSRDKLPRLIQEIISKYDELEKRAREAAPSIKSEFGAANVLGRELSKILNTNNE